MSDASELPPLTPQQIEIRAHFRELLKSRDSAEWFVASAIVANPSEAMETLQRLRLTGSPEVRRYVERYLRSPEQKNDSA